MKIRHYYGHDADSVNGFNDGYYIDSGRGIDVADHAEALRTCLAALHARRDINPAELTEDENGYTLNTCYSDENGNEITRAEYDALNEENDDVGGYRYVFLNYEIIEE